MGEKEVKINSACFITEDGQYIPIDVTSTDSTIRLTEISLPDESEIPLIPLSDETLSGTFIETAQPVTHSLSFQEMIRIFGLRWAFHIKFGKRIKFYKKKG